MRPAAERAARGRAAQVREDDTRPRPAASRPPPPSAAEATPGPTRVALGAGASAHPRPLTPPAPGQRPPPPAPGQRPPPPAPGPPSSAAASEESPLEADYQQGPYASWFDARPSRVADGTDAIAGIILQEKGRDRGTRVTPRIVGGGAGRPWRLLAGIGLLALLAAGALGLVWWQRDAPSGRQAPTAPAEASRADPSPLEQGLAETQARLPVAVAADSVDVTAYLVAGPEGVRSVAGPVPGLITARVPDTLVTVDDQGAWIPGLVEALTRAVDSPRMLTLALDAGTDARSVARFARSGRRAGFERFALVVQPPGAADARGSLEFELPGSARPSAGVAVVRVGRLGVHASVEGRDGRKLDEGDMVPRRSGRLDREGLDRLLTRLTGAHPLVRVALLHANGDLPLPELVDVVSVLRTAGERDRYPTVWLAVH